METNEEIKALEDLLVALKDLRVTLLDVCDMSGKVVEVLKAEMNV